MQNQYMGMKIKNLHEKDFRMQKLNEMEALEDEKKNKTTSQQFALNEAKL